MCGPRRCVGIWRPELGHRQPCPFAAPIAGQATSAQCQPCSAADDGHQLARDQLADDGRDYGLYLAWLGPNLPKVGLTAGSRGTDRLAEQGALAYTWLTTGSLPAIRAMEKAISASGIAAERYHRRTKLTAWRRLTGTPQHRAELDAAHARIVATVPWPEDLVLQPCRPVDNSELFGLDRLPTGLVDEVTELQSGARIAGTVRCLVGRELVLDTDDRPVVLDARLLGGWPIRRCDATRTTGAALACLDLSRSDDADTDQTALF